VTIAKRRRYMHGLGSAVLSLPILGPTRPQPNGADQVGNLDTSYFRCSLVIVPVTPAR
jgi:hypothetical protein